MFRLFFFFFFSSRRRHTRSLRDWSSDVCSSDLFPLVRREPRDRDVRANRVTATGPEKIVVGRLVRRGVPGGDGAVGKGQSGVRDDFLEVHADDPPEALTRGAGPEWRVECEERRRGFAEVRAAG